MTRSKIVGINISDVSKDAFEVLLAELTTMTANLYFDTTLTVICLTKPAQRDDVKIKLLFSYSHHSPSSIYKRGGSYFTIVLIFAIAFAGFNPFGHTFVQFIIV